MNTTRNATPTTTVSGNRIFLIYIYLFSFLLLISTFLACFFSYQQKKDVLLHQIDSMYDQLSQKYRNVLSNVWQMYMPIFEYPNDVYTIWNDYFNADSDEPLSVLDQRTLSTSLERMLSRDNDIEWIALYSANRSDNYILYKGHSGVQLLTEDFPYMQDLVYDTRSSQIYGMRSFMIDNYNSNFSVETYAVCGSVPADIGKGKVLAGYSIDPMTAICNKEAPELTSLNYVLTSNEEILFDNRNTYNKEDIYYTQSVFSGITEDTEGHRLYVHSKLCGSNTTYLYYYYSWWELFLYCNSNTPLLVSIFFIFALISVSGYLIMMRQVSKEVSVIHNGLTEIGENNLNYRLPLKFNQSGLTEIADSINQMTERLQNQINRSYYYELKHREAELSELQSKFNPHFLYNTLEMLRARCEASGDGTTANLISQLSGIFRGFVGSKAFVPMTEELNFSKKYLTLFGARYEDRIDIRYDFEEEIRQYGIILNLFQPLIENYFIHGFDTSSEQNYISFQGKSLDEDHILLTVEDNGSGMTLQEMEALNARLHETIRTDAESYGLKNLHQRISLFYGDGCGLTVYSNPNDHKGISIQMIVKKITCEEYRSFRKHTELK